MGILTDSLELLRANRPRGVREPHTLERKDSSWGWLTSAFAMGSKAAQADPISEGDLYGIPAAWRCYTFICNAVASCAPPQVFSGDDRLSGEGMPAVVSSPWPLMSTHEYWTNVVGSLLLFGNFVGIPADFDPVTGWPRQVIPTHPGEVRLEITDGLPRYVIRDVEYAFDEVVHIRAQAPPGALWGIGIIEAFRAALGEQLDHQEYGTNLYGGSAVPPMVITVDRQQLTENEAIAIQDRFVARHSGGNKEPAVLPNSMEIKPLAFKPADAQFLESRRWSANEIAYMFGMDPSDIGVSMPGSSLTYQSLGERSQERLTHTVGPWLRRIEQSWSMLLPGDNVMRFNAENLLRTNTETRLDASKVGIEAGILTLNDARRIERLPAYGDWANEPFATPPGNEVGPQAEAEVT